MSHRAQFAMVDQSVNNVKKLEQYISSGMETTVEIAQDLVEHDKDLGNTKVNELRDIMLQYAKMELDMRQFLEAVEDVKQKAKAGNVAEMELDTMLKSKLKEIQDENRISDLKEHPKIVELNDKVQALTEGPSQENSKSQAADVSMSDVELAMTQAEVNTKCPYTGKEMKDPVKNVLCGHSYEREGIQQLIKARKGRAKCPVAGCINDKVIQMEDVVDNNQLKRQINARKREDKQKGKK